MAADRILLIDDDESIREVVRLFLNEEGYAVRDAPHGRAGLDLLVDFEPDLILLDLRMPVMDGWEFARRYRALPIRHAPIVAFIASLDAGHDAESVDATAVVEKPFDLLSLKDIIVRSLAR